MQWSVKNIQLEKKTYLPEKDLDAYALLVLIATKTVTYINMRTIRRFNGSTYLFGVVSHSPKYMK